MVHNHRENACATKPDFARTDRTELRRLNRRYGKERVVGWLRAKVALPTRLELKELNGEDVDKDAYYEALADHYVDTGTDRTENDNE